MAICYLLFSLLLSLVAAQDLSSCIYEGTQHPSDPFTPVVGATHTCYCNKGKWERCEPNTVSASDPFAHGFSQSFQTSHAIPPPQTPTALELRAEFKPSDFVFNLRAQPPSSSGLGGEIRPASLEEFPALRNQGVSYTLFNLDPCGINLPHVHPRATEIIFVTKGKNLRTAFVEENGGRTVVNDINYGQITFFPEGLIHYQQNLGCEPVEFLSALNSEDPGVITISTRTFTLPSEALQATFNLNAAQIEIIKKGIPAGPAKGRIECLKRCKLGHVPTHPSGWEDTPNLGFGVQG